MVDAPTVAWSNFARKHSSAGSGNSYSTLSEEQVVDVVRAAWGSRVPGTGETDTSRKVLVPVPPTGFCCAPKAKLVVGLPIKAEVFARQDGEMPYIRTYVTAEDAKRLGVYTEVPAVTADIVCYSAAALLENGGTRSSDAEWEIVAILCNDTAEKAPMTPLTMARNFLEKPGGSKGVYSAQEFAEAIWHWSLQGIRVQG